MFWYNSYITSVGTIILWDNKRYCYYNHEVPNCLKRIIPNYLVDGLWFTFICTLTLFIHFQWLFSSHQIKLFPASCDFSLQTNFPTTYCFSYLILVMCRWHTDLVLYRSIILFLNFAPYFNLYNIQQFGWQTRIFFNRR